MQSDFIRMYATAVSFDEIKVYLSSNYYNGISSKFYIKELHSNQSALLQGDAHDEENGFKTYLLHTKIELEKRYVVTDAYGLTCFLDLSPLTLTEEFDQRYYYDGDDLGSQYSKHSTIFKVWSPLSTSVILKLKKGSDVQLYSMTRNDKGVFGCKVKKDLEGYRYVYIIENNTSIIETCDPYAYASTSNMKSSIVVDLKKLERKKSSLPLLKHSTDAIIYELGVRDFSVDAYGKLRHKGKFLAFCEEGNVTEMGYLSGIDYLKDLGITHVQLMPINDFATVDEDLPYELYNWGYDPAQYNTTEGSYVTLPNDGYRRVNECQKMIESLHKNGLRVILDVVYNHMHDVNQNALEKTVPYYFFRRDENGYRTNGTWCGNDFNTTAKMCRKYILDMCKRWQLLYGADGFRMDLMGIIDIDTVNAIYRQGKAIDPSFLLYGEGWNMGTLPENQKAIIENNQLLPGVGFFNNYFRDTLRGNNQLERKGYISGDTYKTNEAIIALCDYGKFSSIEQNLNYLECHDNATNYDKLLVSNAEENELCRQRRCMIGTAMILLAQGMPFLHAGQEFFDTKGGNANSYNAGDNVNKFDWGRKDQYLDQIEFVKMLIRLRKDNPCFRHYDYQAMRDHIRINNINHRMIEYILTQDQGQYEEIRVYFNPSYDYISVQIDSDFKVLYSMEQEEITDGSLTVKGVSMAICVR